MKLLLAYRRDFDISIRDRDCIISCATEEGPSFTVFSVGFIVFTLLENS